MGRIFFDDYKNELINRIEQSIYRETSTQKKLKGLFLNSRELAKLMKRYKIWIIYYLKSKGELNFNRYFKLHVKRFKKRRKYRYSERFLDHLINNPDEIQYHQEPYVESYKKLLENRIKKAQLLKAEPIQKTNNNPR